MSYKKLKSIYYSSHNEYEQEYFTRFNAKRTIHLDFSVHENPAFYIITPEVYEDIIGVLDDIKSVINIKAGLPGIAINQFITRCLIDEIVITNNIEGVSSTRREVNRVLNNLQKEDHNDRFYGLVKKYHALQTKSSIPMQTCQDIRSIYDDIVLDEVVAADPKNRPDGEIFRKDKVHVTSPRMETIHTGLLPEAKIIASMDKALDYLNSGKELPLCRIAAFHYMLGYIHPFYDGNGRLNRFISSYALSSVLDPLMSYRLSYTIKDNIAKYNNAFKDCNDTKNKGDITPFLEMFMNVLRQSSSSLLAALTKRKARMDHYTSLISALPGAQNSTVSQVYNILIQAELFSEYGVSVDVLQECIKVSGVTAKKYLDVIRREGLLKEVKESRKKYYGIDLERIDKLYSDHK